jgi:hypothetical protein
MWVGRSECGSGLVCHDIMDDVMDRSLDDGVDCMMRSGEYSG